MNARIVCAFAQRGTRGVRVKKVDAVKQARIDAQLRSALLQLARLELSFADIARLYGVHRVTVHAWFKVGRISKDAYARTAFIPSIACDIDWRSLRPDLLPHEHLRRYTFAKRWAKYAGVADVEKKMVERKTHAHMFETQTA